MRNGMRFLPGSVYPRHSESTSNWMRSPTKCGRWSQRGTQPLDRVAGNVFLLEAEDRPAEDDGEHHARVDPLGGDQRDDRGEDQDQHQRTLALSGVRFRSADHSRRRGRPAAARASGTGASKNVNHRNYGSRHRTAICSPVSSCTGTSTFSKSFGMHRLVQRAAPLRPAGALSFGDCGIGRRRPRLGRDRRNVRGRFRRRFASGLDFDRRFGRRPRAREARLRPAGIAHSQVGHDSFGDQVDRWLVRDHKHA